MTTAATSTSALGRTLTLRPAIGALGFYDPEREKATSGVSRGLVWAGTAVALLLGGISLVLVTAMLVADAGVPGALVGATIAMPLAPLYLLLFLWLDRYDPEPPWLVAAAFSWGALIAIFVSMVVNTAFGITSVMLFGRSGAGMGSLVSAPLVEESSKGIFLVIVLVFLRRELDGVLDGIVLAGFVSLGFAMVEDALYYGRAFADYGVGEMLWTLAVRGLVSPFAHSLFTAMTGIGCGIARETHNPVVKFSAPIAGWFVAVLLHASWNNLSELVPQSMFYGIYLLVWVPLFLLFLGVLAGLGVRERRIVHRMLELDVARGYITRADQELSSSFGKRLGWLLRALPSVARIRRRRQYLRTLTKLAFCYWHVERATEAKTETMSFTKIPELLEEIRDLRPQVA